MPRAISLHKTSQLGLRETNEDVERFVLNLDAVGRPKKSEYAPIDFYVICDGHGGDQVAKFVAPELEKHLTRPNLIYPLEHRYICKIFSYVQDKLTNHPSRIASCCGCTALVLVRYLDKKGRENIQVINIGDCRALLSRDGLAIPLTKDHKPYWPDERTRINYVNRKNPSNVREIMYYSGDYRVGDLSVSKSLGDLDNKPQVSHLPDSYVYKLHPTDEFIIMACDGLWDNIQNHEAVNFVKDHLNNNTDLYKLSYKFKKKTLYYPSAEIDQSNNISKKLAHYAIAKGSSDNVSILIIFFKNKRPVSKTA